MGDFYDLATRRKVELDQVRADLNRAETELAQCRLDLRDADREIKALRDELDYVHQERDDLERQLDPLSAPCSVCGAQPFEPCETPLRYRMPKPHTTRNAQP